MGRVYVRISEAHAALSAAGRRPGARLGDTCLLFRATGVAVLRGFAGLANVARMSDQLKLDRVRSVLIRLEETILFSLIERAQYPVNAAIYEPGRFGAALEGESLVGYMLRECERSHAKVRRYTSPDEHPFYEALPAPILPALCFTDNPLHANTVNINAVIRRRYEDHMVPFLCAPGDDAQYGSSAVCDVNCLQNLSKRIHYGKFVAESKYRAAPERFRAMIEAGDDAALYQAVTDAAVEQAVLDRVARKADTYTRELAGLSGTPAPEPDRIADIYRTWIIPLNKRVQTAYLLQR